MNVLIFGASGVTGHEIVKQALEQNHVVTAFVRNPEKIKIKHESLKIFQGDVRDYESIMRAIQNQDSVISTLGVSVPLKRDPILIDGIRNIVNAMQMENVKRFIYLSFIGVKDSRSRSGFLLKNLVCRIVKNEIIDHEEKEKIIKQSKLNWTIVRPPKLTNGRKKEKYRCGENIKTNKILPTLSRADLSDFILKQLNNITFENKAVLVL